MNTTTEIHDYEILVQADRLTVFPLNDGHGHDFDLADFFDFVAPAFNAWNEPKSQSLIFEGPVEGKVVYSKDGGEWVEYPCRADSMTWEDFIKEHRGDISRMVEQYFFTKLPL